MVNVRELRLLLILLCFFTQFAWSGNVSVHPKRLVFENGQSQAKVYLMNLGDKPTTMRIRFRNYRMQPNGQLTPVVKVGAGERFADPFVRYSPKRVRLQPGESQLVRVRIDRNSLPASGEYRSHLAFVAEPDVSQTRNANASDPGSDAQKRIKIALKPVFGSSIPVIIRHGDISANTEVVKVSVNELGSQAKVNIVLGRIGEASVYGDVYVVRKPIEGKPIILAKAKGVGVYPPLSKRYLSLTVPPDLRHHLSAISQLRVLYTAHGNPSQPLAELTYR